VRQKGILLSLVKAVDFVNKQHGTFTDSLVHSGAFKYFADVGHTSCDGTDFDKIGFDFGCDNSGQCCLAAARRPP
jgi:hypothetical protein